LIATVIAIIVLSFIISRWSFFSFNELPIGSIIFVFILKSIAGYISYKYHYIYFAGGDGAIYLQGGKDLLSFSGGNPIVFLKLFLNLNRGIPEWESIYTQIIYWDSKSSFNFINDNRNAIRLNALINLLSFNNLGIHIALLNFLSIIGLTALYKSFRSFLPSIFPLAVFVAVFLSPSVIFWTSGILKETHTILFIGLYMLLLNKLTIRVTLKNALIFLLLAFLLILVRSYFAIIIFSSSFLLIMLNYIQFHQPAKKILIISSILIILVLAVFLLPINLSEIIIQKQQDFIFIGQKANSFFELSIITNTADIIFYFPEAFINVFLQPQLFSFDSWLYIFPIIENIDILFFCFLAMKFTKWPPKKNYSVLLSIIMIYLLSSWIIGMTVPVQGAIARYKSLSQPFLLLFIFSFVDWDLLKKKYFSLKSDQ